jgi:Cu+-exporting ATPase
MLYALVSTSDHPISKGIRNYLEREDASFTPLELSAVKTIQAKGIEANWQGHTLLGGNAVFMQEHGIDCNTESRHTLFYFAVDGQCMVRFELSDTLRSGTAEALSKIQAMGVEVVMLTGDHEQSAQHIAQAAGISHIRARLLPQEKAAFIEQKQQEGHIVVMAGDGINDAIALAQANIAIAMGNGTDIAISVSDVVLMDEKPQSLLHAYHLSRRTYRAVKENLGLSLLYNTIAIPLAVTGHVTPLVAALSMSLSSLIVVGNSMRIKFLKGAR